MAGNSLVRPSRDGDQFHYLWAARQCLELLPGISNLVALTVEGASVEESPSSAIDSGEDLIDVGLYYGSEKLDIAQQVRYVQLKHSTRQQNDPWTASGLEKTIRGFAKRFAELLKRFPADDVLGRFRFEFTTNRPIAPTLAEALADLASAAAMPRHPTIQRTLVDYTSLDLGKAQQFFSVFKAEGSEGNLWIQRNILALQLGSYLPGDDADAPIQLKELVTKKATTEFESNPSIRRHDVLRALRASEERLQPAPSQIRSVAYSVAREQEAEIELALASATTPVVIHADGGVGKSVLATRLTAQVPAHSVAILYDCFGDGLYRTSLHFRHRHVDALVQISNELAARGLCHPLIPSMHADAKQYMRAFLNRLEQAVILLRAQDPRARLYLIIDAADNAEMAAEEQREPASFVRDLIRAPVHEGVRLVFTCRTHRSARLHAPIETQYIELRPFSESESGRHLRTIYPDATDAEVAEFSLLSSANPRVQALALAQKLALPDMLRQLGPTPTTVDRAIGELLEKAFRRLRDHVGPVEASQADTICRALAVLRPLVPIPVLAQLSGTSESAIRSFALDFGRPLLVQGDSLHFTDEPAETWFRENFRPDTEEMERFLAKLRPLSKSSSYAAAILPQLLLETGKLDELIQLALSGDGLPSDNPLSRRDVELQRLIFALQACLQQGRHLAAAKLALKAGGEFAGEDRLNRVIQDNTDLAAVLMPPDRLEEIVSRRTFSSGWMGSHHAYDAGLLSGRAELAATASSRLRMALDWLYNWARTAPEDRIGEDVSDTDRAELAMTLLRLRGAGKAVKFLRGWIPRRLALQASCLVARRLVDLGHYGQLDDLANAAGNSIWVLMGVAIEARKVGHALPAAPLARAMRLLNDRRVKLAESDEWRTNWQVLFGVSAVIEQALVTLPQNNAVWAATLRRYLPLQPPRDLANHFGLANRIPLVRAYALEAALRGEQVRLIDLAPPDVRVHMESNERYVHSREAAVFQQDIGGLLPWSIMACEISCGRSPHDLSAAIATMRSQTTSATRGHATEIDRLMMDIAVEWFQLICGAKRANGSEIVEFVAWLNQQRFGSGTLTKLCRIACRVAGFESYGLGFAASAFQAIENSRENAESQAQSYLKLARAILPVSQPEAIMYFDRAVEIANRIGDENLDRWAAFLHLAHAAGEANHPKPKTAYELSRMAELTYRYVDRDKYFDWDRTVEAIAELCPSSCFAILSRWRDRRFGEHRRLLPVAVYHLMGKGLLPVATPLAFAGIDADWRRTEDLDRFCESEADSSKRAVAARVAYRYIRTGSREHKSWCAIGELGKRFGLSFPDIDRLISASAVTTKAAQPDGQHSSVHASTHRGPHWTAIFQGVDLTNSDQLLSAYAALRTYDPPYELEKFYSEAFARVKTGREPELICAIANWPKFGLYEARNLAKALPSASIIQLSVRKALREAVLAACRREPAQVRRSGWAALFPAERPEYEALVSEMDIVRATLEGFTEKAMRLDSASLFQLIDPLSACMSPSEAEEALVFGFNLLQDVVRPEDGDGPWRSVLQPPDRLLSAIAGYVWAGLGSPEVAVRWEYAHTVRNLIETDWAGMIEALAIHALLGSESPFNDNRLAFYTWHARQWLSIGIARGALENPRAVLPLVPLLKLWACQEHVLIRELAAAGLRALVTGRLLDPGEVEHLNLIGAPKTSKAHDAISHEPVDDDTHIRDSGQESDEKYYFGIDIGPYWFSPLGRAFGLNQNAIERCALSMMRLHMMWNGKNDDARYELKIFEGRETSHSHGSLPDTDDLRAYYAYHAMMFVAAQLLNQYAPRHDQDELKDEFQQWFESYWLTRADENWIADRLDPRCVADPPAPEGYSDQLWQWGIAAEYLDRALITDDGMTTVWGHWNGGDSRHDESISIRSALVPRLRAEALVAALQTASELNRFYLPDATERPSKHAGPFKLIGWINEAGTATGLDEDDPWAEGMHFPGPAPSQAVIETLGLVASADGRSWTAATGRLRSETWTRHRGLGNDAGVLPGSRLSVDRDFLGHLFRTMPDKCLILSVAIRRRVEKHRDDEDEFANYYVPYTRYYLLGDDCVAQIL